MKKSYFLIFFISICYLANAQVKMYEYPSQVLTAEGIEKLVAQSKENGTSEIELRTFRSLLNAKMQKQQNDPRNGIIQRNHVPVVNSSGCANEGFENGTNSNWAFSSADINGVTLPCNTCPTGTMAINAVVNSVSTIAGQCTNGMDIYGNFPIVAPGGGTYSLLLNDGNYMGKMEEAFYTFVVTPSNNIYTFQYAAVLNSGGHAATANPYFYVALTDSTTGSPLGCTQYTISAPASGSMPGWNISPTCGGNACNTVYYKTWTTVAVDLSSSLGHTITAQFLVSDCANGGHFGYVYLDASCGSYTSSNSATICSGNNANLCGPAGYTSYNWYGPVTGATQCLSTNTPGTYTLNATSGPCPGPLLTFSVTTSSSGPPVISITGTDTICLGQPVTLTASGASTYAWTNGVSNGIAFTPTTTANYIVTATDAGGCSSQDSITVVVQNCSSEIKSINSISSIRLFPNPATNIVTLQSEEKLGTILIYNSIGETVLQAQSSATKMEIDISKLPVGVYSVKVQSKYLRLVKE